MRSDTENELEGYEFLGLADNDKIEGAVGACVLDEMLRLDVVRLRRTEDGKYNVYSSGMRPFELDARLKDFEKVATFGVPHAGPFAQKIVDDEKPEEIIIARPEGARKTYELYLR